MKKYIILTSLIILCSSCASSKKINYLQDVALNVETEIQSEAQITLQPQDAVTIVVSSKDPKLAALFNLPRVSYRAGATQLASASYDSQMSQYTINSRGCIDFPILGEIEIAGHTRENVAEMLKAKLLEADMIKDLIVTVEYVNLYFSIIGEVARPGKYKIERDRINIFEAISTAGDLTIVGKRDRIYVTRETDKKRTVYQLDLRSKDIFESPAFYIKQNDIIYIQPNKVRANQSTLNGNSTRSVATWLSVGSILATLAVLIFK